jgi:2-iminobutanoate/2-iminopropanoate deaminase
MHRSINHKSVNVSPTYSAATEVVKPERVLFISGQVGRDTDGKIAEGVEAQAEIAWRNVLTCLAEADMTVDDIVDTMAFLVGRESNAGYDSVRSLSVFPLEPVCSVVL